MKKHLTTGKIAKLCGVAPRTVSSWFDSGRLKGFRIPPQNPEAKNQGDRRVPIEELLRFLIDNNMPREGILSSKIVMMGVSEHIVSQIQELDEDLELINTRDQFQFGMLVNSHLPALTITDVAAMGVHSSNNVAKTLKTVDALSIGLVYEDTEVCVLNEFDHLVDIHNVEDLKLLICENSALIQLHTKDQGQ